MVMLSARGVSEISTTTEESTEPFYIPDDPIPSTGILPESVTVDLFTVLRQWSEMQRKSYELLEKAFAGVPPGLSVVTSSSERKPVPRQFPVDLLAKPLENILISDERLGLPAGCVAVITRAGILSLAMLAEKVESGTVTRLPRIGKAKASVIGETVRAFMAAAKNYREESDS